jgi:hypothetical protein
VPVWIRHCLMGLHIFDFVYLIIFQDANQTSLLMRKLTLTPSYSWRVSFQNFILGLYDWERCTSDSWNLVQETWMDVGSGAADAAGYTGDTWLFLWVHLQVGEMTFKICSFKIISFIFTLSPPIIHNWIEERINIRYQKVTKMNSVFSIYQYFYNRLMMKWCVS